MQPLKQICNRCGVEKGHWEFHFSNKYGKPMSICKDCKKKKIAEWRTIDAPKGTRL